MSFDVPKQLLKCGYCDTETEIMEKLSRYGNIGFVTTYYSFYSAEAYAEKKYRSAFGSESGTQFLIALCLALLGNFLVTAFNRRRNVSIEKISTH